MTRRPAQRGQALAEFVVIAASALLLLLLAITMLGKLDDVRSKVLMSSRYAAWERTVWMDEPEWTSHYGSTATKSDADIRSEIAQRVLGHDAPALRATDRSARSLAAGGLPMWEDHAGAALLQRYQDVSTQASREETGGVLGGITRVLDAGSAIGMGFDLSTRNLRTAEVGFTVGASNAAIRQLWPDWRGLTLSDHYALLSNAWTPDGRSAAETLVGGAVLTSKLSTIDRAVLAPLIPLGTEITRLDLGRIRTDVVPQDRLGAR
ncbi:hypothetical protein AAFF27_03775 [Xylophilus sp. GW821-FHT01B05]